MKRQSSLLTHLGRIEGLPIALVLVILYGAFLVTAPQVFSGIRIYMSFLQTVPPQLILALGLTLVITAGEMDLSFPAVVAFAGFAFAWVFKTFDAAWAPWAGLLLALWPARSWGMSTACSWRDSMSPRSWPLWPPSSSGMA